MTYEMALELAQTETPDQMADRIVELYETINELTNPPQSGATAPQPIIRLEYSDRNEAIRALRVGDYADALETIGNALRTESKYADHSPGTTRVIDALSCIYYSAVEYLPEEL